MTGPPIVVVDDDDPFRSMLREMLSRAGYHVIEARTAREALRACERAHAGLMITDLQLPNEDVLQAISTLRTAHPELRIIATSGGAKDEDAPTLARARRSGADGALPKPFSRSQLLEMVQTLLARG